MKIDIPFEIGDPILVLERQQFDGWYINCRSFEYNDIGILDRVFKTRKEAVEALAILEKEENKR